MGLRSKSRTRLLILTAAVTGTVVVLGGLYGYRKMVRAREIAAAKPLGIAAYKKGEWVESLNLLQSYLNKYDNDQEAIEYFLKVRLKLPETQQSHQKQAMAMYRRLVSLKPRDMDAKRELLKLYMSLQMNTELLSGADDIIREITSDFVVPGSAPVIAPATPAVAGAATSPSTAAIAPAATMPASQISLLDAIKRIKEKARDSDPAQAEAARKKYIEPLADALEWRAIATANLRRSNDALLAADALIALRPDAKSTFSKLNAMRMNNESKDAVLAELSAQTGWKKGGNIGQFKDEPTVALISGMYLAYNDVDTAVLAANRAAELGAASEDEATKLADLLDRIERKELFEKARKVIEDARSKYSVAAAKDDEAKTRAEALDDEHFRRMIFDRRYQQAAEEIAKIDVLKRPTPMAMRLIALCEWSKQLDDAGKADEAAKKKAEAEEVLKALDTCGKRWDTLAIGWHDVLSLVYFSRTPEDRKVVDACTDAIMRDPTNPFFYFYQGESYRATGDLVSAGQRWQAAAYWAPAWDQPLSRTARAFANSGDPVEALRRARAANDRLPGQKETQVAIVISWRNVVARLDLNDTARRRESEDLLKFIDSNLPVLRSDENVRAIEVVTVGELQGIEAAAKRLSDIVNAATKDDSRVLLRLAVVAGRLNGDFSLTQLCVDKYKSLCGMTAELAATKCAVMFDEQSAAARSKFANATETERKQAAEGVAAAIKKEFQDCRTQAGAAAAADREKWDIEWCKILDVLRDPRAHDEWKNAIALYGKSINALWDAHHSTSVKGDHLLDRQVLELLKGLIGDSGLQWRLAMGEWLLDDTVSTGSVEQATNLLGLAVTQAPDSADARKLLARGWELTGNLNNAISQLVRATEIDPGDLEVKLNLARLYLRQNDSARALEQLTRVLAMLPPVDPRNPGNMTEQERDYRRRTGWMLSQAGDVDKAEMAIRGVTGDASIDQLRIVHYWRQGKMGDALVLAEKLVAGNPSPEVIEQVLPLYALTGKADLAEAAFAKLKDMPESGDSPNRVTGPQKHAIRGTYYASVKKWDEAVQELGAAVKDEPKNDAYWRRLIATLLTSGRLDEGVKTAADSASAMPGDPGCASVVKLGAQALKDEDLR
ncbi:MAG TPA: tetratricopeptide repeat protein, partial [Phycisphaerae bacterium]|nr:tetratricopeptide repeat protein [Phycisphaerae bacterium]